MIAVPQRQPDQLTTGGTATIQADVDRPCAGCNRSVSSETGGVVVAFGNSLWHVDCFKCAKCGNLVDANTNLLLLSDGSPVCANCYNCKVCNLPILDEAVMTGEDSYHAACFTCRSCKNRIDELVFAKTSQGFYCMKCHNERVARSRRHAAKQKQKERERAGLGSSSGRNGAIPPSFSGDSSTHRGMDQAKEATSVDRSASSSMARPGYGSGASAASSTGSHHHDHPRRYAQGSSTSTEVIDIVRPSSNPVEPDSSFISHVGSDTTALPVRSPGGERSSVSSVPPSVSVTAPGPGLSSSRLSGDRPFLRSSADSHSSLLLSDHGDPTTASTLEGPPPPPYSITPPPHQATFGVESARSSGSYGRGTSSGPTSPSFSPQTSQENSSSADHGSSQASILFDHSSSSSLAYMNPGSQTSSESISLQEHHDVTAKWRADEIQSKLSTSLSEGNQSSSSFLRPRSPPSSSSSGGLSAPKSRREKRGSINPGLQLEASRYLQLQSELPVVAPSSVPTSPTVAGSSTMPPSSQHRTQSPTAGIAGRESPRMMSPLKESFAGAENENGDSDKSFASNGTSFYSPAPSPQLHRAGSPSGTKRSVAATPQKSPPGPLGLPAAQARKDLLARLPQRSDSLRGGDAVAALKSTAPTVTRGAFSPRLLPNPPGPTLRTQRSFDDRPGRLSPRRADFGSDAGKRSRSVSPKPPDVPRSIESGTDTSNDTDADGDLDIDDITQSYKLRETDGESLKSNSSERPPAPPPKDARGEGSESKDQSASADASVSSSIASVATDTELSPTDGEHLEDTHSPHSPMSSTAGRQSAFFMTPALPPMRFSMNGADFREILNNLGGPNGNLSPNIRNSISDAASTSALTIRDENRDDVASSTTPTSATPTLSPLADSNPAREPTNAAADRSINKTISRTPSPDVSMSRTEVERPTTGHRSTSSISPPTSPRRADFLRRSPHRVTKSETSIKTLQAVDSPRSSSESQDLVSRNTSANGAKTRERLESNVSIRLNGFSASPRTPAVATPRPGLVKQDTSSDLALRRLQEALSDAAERGADHIKLNKGFVEAIISALEQKKDLVNEMNGKLDGMKRTSQLMIDGLSVAHDEYDQELTARRNAEAEISRLKIELSGQAARLTALTSDDRRREVHKQLAREISDSLSGLERDLSKLKVERDMTLAEVEELSATKGSSPTGEVPAATVGRSLTMRLDSIKRQYQHELLPLTQQKESLQREIRELKEARDIFLEETAVLNARNEELAQLISEYERRLEHSNTAQSKERSGQTQKGSMDTWRPRQAPPMANATSTTSTASSATLYDDPPAERVLKPKNDVAETPQGKGRGIGIRWPGNKANKEQLPPSSSGSDGKGKKRLEHTFQQLSILRFARCDHCGDKMWGSQVRCTACNVAVHMRCVAQVQSSCVHDASVVANEDPLAQLVPPPPSMFGRDLVEQVQADAKGSERFIPIIVEKCIDAVEALAMDYEGIYRKSGGSGQSKAITQLFEKGNYEAFDLRDSDTFNDISSVTSVLKNYFRSLPNPLLTYALHDSFVSAAGIRDPQAKGEALTNLVSQLPSEHYHTLGRLMVHLHRIQLECDTNLMTARNLGVVFGPTLMRSQDPSLEFADMAGKTLAIEWLIENAPSVFFSATAAR